MADPTALLTTIDDYLLSLADGIALAQNELSRTAAAGPPGKQFTYYLPKLEFELRMRIQVTQDQALSHRYESVRDPAVRDKHLLFSPVNASQSSSSSSSVTEVISTVKGSFVAVPANEGLPAVVLRSRVEANGRAVTVFVDATNAAAEPLGGLSVEVNIDRDESETMSADEGVPTLDWTDTWLDAGVVRTAPTGEASVLLNIGTAMPAGAHLVLAIDAAQQTEMLVIEVPA